MDFIQCHQSNNYAATCCRIKHFEIFATVARNVMLTMMAFVFRNTARQHSDTAFTQVAGAVLLYRRVNHRIHQIDG